MPEQNAPQIRRKRRRKNGFKYLMLFACVFIVALLSLSYIVKSFSPEVDVTIGNHESMTLTEPEIEFEIKTIDERLKWIQMEDELPTVSVKKDDEKVIKKDKKEEKKIKKKESKEIKEVKDVKEAKKEVDASEKVNVQKQQLDFKLAAKPIPLPTQSTPTISKVYVGRFNTIEEATSIQHKIAAEEPDIVPFIKAINGKYIVQIGSFSDPQRAAALSSKMRSKGYSANIMSN